MRRRRNPEIITGRVSGTGAIQYGTEFTVLRTGVGAYTVTFASSFRLGNANVGSADPSGFALASLTGITGNQLMVTTRVPSTNAGVDAAFTFTAVSI